MLPINSKDGKQMYIVVCTYTPQQIIRKRITTKFCRHLKVAVLKFDSLGQVINDELIPDINIKGNLTKEREYLKN